MAAAAVEAVGGAKARRAIAQSEEVTALRGEIDRLRDSLEREQQLVGDLRAQRARSDAIIKDAIQRLDVAEKRERRAQLRIGELLTRTPTAVQKAKGKPRTRRGMSLSGRKAATRAAAPSRQVALFAKVKAKTAKRESDHPGRQSKARRKQKTERVRR